MKSPTSSADREHPDLQGTQARVAVRRAVALPLQSGATPTLVIFDGLADDRDHFALVYKHPRPDEPPAEMPLVRIHSSCATGDLLGSDRCDCGAQFSECKVTFAHQGGILIYLQQEGRGIGLAAKVDAYALQDQGLDTFAANRALGFRDDERDYRVAAQMLDLLVPSRRVRLLTNNPDKARALESHGIHVEECVPTGVYVSTGNRAYLQAKREAGHRLTLAPELPNPAAED